MKRLINKLVGSLNAIAKDKYQHFAVGAVISAVAPFCAYMAFSETFGTFKINFYICIRSNDKT